MEHGALVTQLIREKCGGRDDLTVLWLDLANACPPTVSQRRSNAWSLDQVRSGPSGSRQQAARSSRFRFLIQSVYNVLPSPSNLHRWGLLSSPVCQWCWEWGGCWSTFSVIAWRASERGGSSGVTTKFFGTPYWYQPQQEHYPATVTITFVQAGEKQQPHPKS